MKMTKNRQKSRKIMKIREITGIWGFTSVLPGSTGFTWVDKCAQGCTLVHTGSPGCTLVHTGAKSSLGHSERSIDHNEKRPNICKNMEKSRK